MIIEDSDIPAVKEFITSELISATNYIGGDSSTITDVLVDYILAILQNNHIQERLPAYLSNELKPYVSASSFPLAVRIISGVRSKKYSVPECNNRTLPVNQSLKLTKIPASKLKKARVEKFLSKFGEVEFLQLNHRKRYAIISFHSVEAAENALSYTKPVFGSHLSKFKSVSNTSRFKTKLEAYASKKGLAR